VKKTLVWLGLVLLWGLPTAAQESGLKRVTFLPQWLPQAQFAGYYVAKERGFYRARGLEVSIRRGGPEMPVADSLAQGLAQFGTMWLASAIKARARGLPLVNLAQLEQRSALMLVAFKKTGIHQPQDLQGKKVGVWREEFLVQPRAFFRTYGLTVTEVPQGGTLNLFLRGGVDAASAMWYNEYNQLILAGIEPEELTVFAMADHGLNFPGDGLYCLEDTYLRDPETARAFAAASLEGWRHAFAHPEEALEVVMKYVEKARVPTNRMHQRLMLARLRELMLPQGAPVALGQLPEGAYSATAQELQQGGFIPAIPAYRDFHPSPLPSP
jgi:NitT/TauT family transport system substrate-binding protein